VNWKKAVRTINKAAARAKDVEAVAAAATGDPSKLVKRAKNKAKGKLLAKIGFWK